MEKGHISEDTRAVKIKGYTVADLPTGHVGDTVFVLDALSATFSGDPAGGGTFQVPVFYDGAKWVAYVS